jgi:hypothetical protein
MKSELPAARRKKWAYRIFKGAAAAENRRTARAQKEFGTGSRQGCGGIIAVIFYGVRPIVSPNRAGYAVRHLRLAKQIAYLRQQFLVLGGCRRSRLHLFLGSQDKA